MFLNKFSKAKRPCTFVQGLFAFELTIIFKEF